MSERPDLDPIWPKSSVFDRIQIHRTARQATLSGWCQEGEQAAAAEHGVGQAQAGPGRQVGWALSLTHRPHQVRLQGKKLEQLPLIFFPRILFDKLYWKSVLFKGSKSGKYVLLLSINISSARRNPFLGYTNCSTHSSRRNLCLRCTIPNPHCKKKPFHGIHYSQPTLQEETLSWDTLIAQPTLQDETLSWDTLIPNPHFKKKPFHGIHQFPTHTSRRNPFMGFTNSPTHTSRRNPFLGYTSCPTHTSRWNPLMGYTNSQPTFQEETLTWDTLA